MSKKKQKIKKYKKKLKKAFECLEFAESLMLSAEEDLNDVASQLEKLCLSVGLNDEAERCRAFSLQKEPPVKYK